MMRLSVCLLLVTLLPGCSNPTAPSSTTLSYSSEFKLSLPAHYLNGATVFYSGELSIKTSSGKSFSGLIISNALESLPEEFDIKDYPAYLLNIKSAENSGLEETIVNQFKNSSKEIDQTFNLVNLNVINNKNLTLYSLCKNSNCLAYVVKSSFDRHILSINANGFDETEFNALLNGGLNVKP